MFLTSCADSQCGTTIPDAPASRAVVSESSSCLGTRTMTRARPSEWVCAAWIALSLLISKTFGRQTVSYSCSSSLLNMPCSTSIQMKSGFVDAMSLVTNVLGIPWATPNSVFAGSACASLKACLRFPGYVSMAARYGA